MYANVVVDISLEKLDKTFQYRIPQELLSVIKEGSVVDIPFGSRQLTGFVMEITENLEYDKSRIKDILGIHEGCIAAEEE